ncbi:hypothetical protein GCM10011512_04680 [Tersicoccus solisilvae]|uniref:Type II secretion system protein GspF domain-containing protein n=1 Tax=Tersicoccus solisilvae TaxID=1882339 RepID=A0ABQ1NMM7_9MICC|nr:hypothetical protein [Tersicoccus solisilvae]GGC80984.1 hypothetical protein GCM10011512_04680 [Tersicoccus solisilvae]
MTGPLTALLLAVAVLLGTAPAGPRRHGAGPDRHDAGRPGAPIRNRVRNRAPAVADLDEQVRTLRQISALLAAGRPLTTVWSDVLTGRAAAAAAARSSTAVVASRAQRAPAAGTGAVEAVLRAAERAARWGHDPTEALRAARHSPVAARGAAGRAVARALADGWAGLADCLDIARATGAPLAGLLDRFAAAQADARAADAARAAALAGPAVTVRILRWLPVAGLGLGILMGTDPVHVLTTTPAGWVLAALAAVLMVAGHLWVRRMLTVAAA